MNIVGRYDWYYDDFNFPWHINDVEYYEGYHNMKAKEKKEFNAILREDKAFLKENLEGQNHEPILNMYMEMFKENYK